ncbi:MAG: 3-hydroxyacyl-CoA dehydrogenase family protein [Chloroflexia bacterium]|nr:3-hydroxyacyl-CoA dehydrogenase family protein [Chloroflexia bacterium]MDQ3413057.1 3-hydroxyacyl-CoA dehydrogenase family protein [Chloroflexota bacterium]
MSAIELQRIAVIGSGLMGHGIALELAAYGYDIRLQDQDPVQLDKAQVAIAEGLARLVAIGRITAEAAAKAPARIATGTDASTAAGDADLVIEAVSENLELKQRLFQELDDWAPPHAILASNTSSFMPSLLAEATNRPDRVLVAHYFNPPHLLPLVELVRGAQTSDATIETMRALYLGIGKAPAVVQKEAPGFVGNRIQAAIFRETLAIVAAGIASVEDVDAIVRNGFGRRLGVAGPFEIADAAGLDVKLAVCEQLFPEIASSTEIPALLREKVARGELGIKAGKGYYAWTPEDAAALRQRIGNGLAAIARLPEN